MSPINCLIELKVRVYAPQKHHLSLSTYASPRTTLVSAHSLSYGRAFHTQKPPHGRAHESNITPSSFSAHISVRRQMYVSVSSAPSVLSASLPPSTASMLIAAYSGWIVFIRTPPLLIRIAIALAFWLNSAASRGEWPMACALTSALAYSRVRITW